MSSIFEVKSSDRALSRLQNQIVKVVRVNQVKFDEKSLRVLDERYGIDFHHILKMLKKFLHLSNW